MGLITYLLSAAGSILLLFLFLRNRKLRHQSDRFHAEKREYQWQLAEMEERLGQKDQECQVWLERAHQYENQTREELENLRRFRDLVEETEEFLFELDAEGRFLYTNPIMQKRLGYDADELKQRHFFSFLLPEKAGEVQAFYKEQFKSKTRGTYAEWEALNRFGEPVFIGIRVNMTFNASGELESVMGSARDLSIQRALRKKNELFEEKLEPFLQGISDPILFIENSARLEVSQIRWANNAFGQLMELDRHRLQTMQLGEVSLSLKELLLEKLSSPRKRLVWQPKPEKGNWFKILAWTSGELLGILLVDISLDEAERRSETFQRQILMSALNALDLEIGMLDPDDKYIFANPAFTNRTLSGEVPIGKSEEERAKQTGSHLERALFWKSKLDEARMIGSKIRFEESVESPDSQIRMLSREILPFNWPNGGKQGFVLWGQDISSRSMLDFQHLESRDRLYFYWRSKLAAQDYNENNSELCSRFFGEPLGPGSPSDCFGEIRYVHYFPITSEQLYEFQQINSAGWITPPGFHLPGAYAESGVFYFPSVLIAEVLSYLADWEEQPAVEIRFSGAYDAESVFQLGISPGSSARWESGFESGVQFIQDVFSECGFKVVSRPDSLFIQGRILWANKPDPERLNLPIPILKGKRIITGPTSLRKVTAYMEELALHGAEIQGTKSIFGINKLLEEGGAQLLVWWGDMVNDWKEIDQSLLDAHGIQVLVYAENLNESAQKTPFHVKQNPVSLKSAVEDAWRFSGSGKSERLHKDSIQPLQLRFDKVLEITEGDKGFMRSLFESYFLSLEECQTSFEKHLNNTDAEALKFLLHKVRATIKTFEIRELEALLRDAIEAVESQSLRNSSDRGRLVAQMSGICQQAKTGLITFARNQGIALPGIS